MRGINWRSFAPAWLKTPVAAALIDAVHSAALVTRERADTAARAYYPRTAPEDALTTLCADRKLPTYSGEEASTARARAVLWPDFLDAAGTLRLVAEIARSYWPSSGNVIAYSRAGYWVRIDGSGESSGKLAGVFDWDSLSYTTLPLDRQNDCFLVVNPPPQSGITPSSSTILRTGETVANDARLVGFDAPLKRDIFRATREAIENYKTAYTCLRCVVFPNVSWFSPAVPAQLPAGEFGFYSTRNPAFRYMDSEL